MDEQLQELIERIEKLESKLEHVVAPGGVPAPVPSQGGAPLVANQPSVPNQAGNMERVGSGSESTWRPVGNFETPEEMQQAARQAHANVTSQQLASAPVAPSPPVQPLPNPNRPYTPEEIERQQGVSRDVGRIENETSYESSVAFADAGNANLAKTNAMQEERSIGNALASGANQVGYQPDEEQSPAEQVHQRAAMKHEQRRERMRASGSTPHIDRFDDAYRSEAYGAAGIPEPSRTPPTPGTSGHQQQSGGFDSIGQFADTSASSMLLMNARLSLAMQQIEELRRDLEMKGHQ